jgi:hypothetical protein
MHSHPDADHRGCIWLQCAPDPRLDLILYIGHSLMHGLAVSTSAANLMKNVILSHFSGPFYFLLNFLFFSLFLVHPSPSFIPDASFWKASPRWAPCWRLLHHRTLLPLLAKIHCRKAKWIVKCYLSFDELGDQWRGGSMNRWTPELAISCASTQIGLFASSSP